MTRTSLARQGIAHPVASGFEFDTQLREWRWLSVRLILRNLLLQCRVRKEALGSLAIMSQRYLMVYDHHSAYAQN